MSWLPCARIIFFAGVFVGRTYVLSHSVVIKPQNTENIPLGPLEAAPSTAQSSDNKININTAAKAPNPVMSVKGDFPIRIETTTIIPTNPTST